jgi:hypothetical protein
MRLAILAAVATVSSGGCKEAHVREAFFPDLNESQTRRVLAVQTSRGARMDATLYPMHFDGSALNSLGQAKLDLMMEDSAGTGPITVYLGGADDPVAQQRRGAVEQYLAASGLQPEQYATIAGANPHATHPASESLSRLTKTENPTSNQQNEETTVKFDMSGMSPGAAAE